jgi:hypothetical protein
LIEMLSPLPQLHLHPEEYLYRLEHQRLREPAERVVDVENDVCFSRCIHINLVLLVGVLACYTLPPSLQSGSLCIVGSPCVLSRSTSRLLRKRFRAGLGPWLRHLGGRIGEAAYSIGASGSRMGLLSDLDIGG